MTTRTIHGGDHTIIFRVMTFLFLVRPCSAGIGRTGTFCTIDLAVRKLLAGDEGGLDIPGIVALLRSQRPGMVQTKVSDQLNKSYSFPLVCGNTSTTC